MPTGQLHNAESPQAAALQRLGDFSSAFALFLFVNDQLRISAVFLIGADQQKIHVCGKAETAAAAVFTRRRSLVRVQQSPPKITEIS